MLGNRKKANKITKEKLLAELSASQRSALPFFLVPKPVSVCCRDAGIPSKTYYEWIRLSPAWNRALEAYQVSAINESKANLKRSMIAASEMLCEKMNSADESIAMRAIEMIFTHSTKFISQDSIIGAIQDVKDKLGITDDRARSDLGAQKDPGIDGSQ